MAVRQHWNSAAVTVMGIQSGTAEKLRRGHHASMIPVVTPRIVLAGGFAARQPAAMRYTIALTSVLLLGLAAPVRAETVLRLAETATVMVHPDLLEATLRAEATAGTAAEAQRQVNTAIAAALERANKTEGVRASTGTYSVWRVGPTPPDRSERWQANQSLLLKGNDGTILLSLVGDLQQKGLAVSALSWQLAPETEKKARAEATRQAITALRGRVDEAASLLGLSFDSFKEVRLDGARPPQPMPRAMMAAAPMAASAPPPTAQAEDIAVTATAAVDAVLVKR
jgi:predicted secreted protein